MDRLCVEKASGWVMWEKEGGRTQAPGLMIGQISGRALIDNPGFPVGENSESGFLFSALDAHCLRTVMPGQWRHMPLIPVLESQRQVAWSTE